MGLTDGQGTRLEPRISEIASRVLLENRTHTVQGGDKSCVLLVKICFIRMNSEIHVLA